MQDDKRNLSEQDDLEDIKMLLGDDDVAPDNADALLDDILKEYQVGGATANTDPDALLAELENLTAQFSGESAEAGEPEALPAEPDEPETVEAEHMPDSGAACCRGRSTGESAA